MLLLVTKSCVFQVQNKTQTKLKHQSLCLCFPWITFDSRLCVSYVCWHYATTEQTVEIQKENVWSEQDRDTDVQNVTFM